MKTISEETGKRLQAMSASIITTFGDEAGISRVAFDTEGEEPVAVVGLIGPVEGLSAECRTRIEEHAAPYAVRFDVLGRIAAT